LAARRLDGGAGGIGYGDSALDKSLNSPIIHLCRFE
jgi:hypothetical protein